MKKELSVKKALAVRCPTCGAAPDEKCELSTGQPRTDPHRDRRVIAKEQDMRKLKVKSVATILEREVAATIKEWLRRVNLLPELARISLNDEDRAGHLPKLFHDMTCRLRLAEGAHLPICATATAHGLRRRKQGYSPAMLVEESRILQVVTFRTLHLHLSELDHKRLLLDVIVIADEADAQLTEAVRSLTTPMS